MKTRTKDARAIVLAQVNRRRAEVGLGAVNPNFTIPSAMTPTAASADLQNAVNALLTAYTASGVPSEHTASPEALAVQEAWNADPIVASAGATARLDPDKSYGPNTHDAVAVVNGGSAPAVNTGPALTTVPTTVVNNTTTTTSTTAAADWTGPVLIGVALVAAAGVTAAAVVHVSKKRKARRDTHRMTHRPTMPQGHRPAYT
jgi:hypothetical protein